MTDSVVKRLNGVSAIDRRVLLSGMLCVSLLPLRAIGAPATQSVKISIGADTVVLSNAYTTRALAMPNQAGRWLRTVDFRSSHEPSKYFLGHDAPASQNHDIQGEEFGFDIDGAHYGKDAGWQTTGVLKAADDLGGEGAEITLHSGDGLIEARLRYLIYPDSPVVRKQLTVKNLSAKTVRLENVDVENFKLESYYGATLSWIYSDYGRRKSLAPFAGGRQDALLALHNPDWQQGILIGSEAPGVLKYAGVGDGAQRFRVGLSRSASDLGFRRWLEPMAEFAAPQTFAISYSQAERFEDVVETDLSHFVKNHLGARIFSGKTAAHSFVYNTWQPFGPNVNAELVTDLATAAADAGVKTFVIDDGWQAVYGDWDVDTHKFPGGLRPVMDHIKSLGMKPGLWVSIGSADRQSKVFNAHPEWFVRNAEGHFYSVHGDEQGDKMTACMSTGWHDYIESVLDRLVTDNGLEYLKLDFAVVTSPYQYDSTKSGCYAHDHAGHKDRNESLFVNYQAMWDLLDRFKAKHPGVFIDCTFEAMGGLQLIDYAMIQHADGNWLSNFESHDDQFDLRVRNMAWWRSPAIPANALVIGNSDLADDGLELHLMSLAGTLPIFLGDVRKMSKDARALSRQYAAFLTQLDARHSFSYFRQDLAGFGEPQDGSWDGFQRINTETQSGGLVGVFRHGAAETRRRVAVNHLSPGATYLVLDRHGKRIARETGAELASTGFEVSFQRSHDGELFEIRKDA